MRRALLIPMRSPIAVLLALAERRRQRACGCSGCRVTLWLDDVCRWARCMPFVLTDAQRSAYSRHGSRMLDAVEPMYVGCTDSFEVLALQRGLDIIQRVTAKLLNPQLSVAIH